MELWDPVGRREVVHWELYMLAGLSTSNIVPSCWEKHVQSENDWYEYRTRTWRSSMTHSKNGLNAAALELKATEPGAQQHSIWPRTDLPISANISSISLSVFEWGAGFIYVSETFIGLKEFLKLMIPQSTWWSTAVWAAWLISSLLLITF